MRRGWPFLLVCHAVLLFGSALMLLPLFWMLSTSLKPYSEAVALPPAWLPWPPRWANYPEAWRAAPFGRYFINSFFVAGLTTAGELVICLYAAYALAWLRFPGRDLFFYLCLATMMVPGELMLIPNYLTLTALGWIDTYQALIVPWVASVFGLFLLRQHFLTLPRELRDAAWLDGCGHGQFLWRVLVPLSGPTLATVALFKFTSSWNSFLWVLLVTNSPALRTVPVGLSAFAGEAGPVYNLWMAAATLSLLPVVILFLAAQRHFVAGVARTGLRG